MEKSQIGGNKFKSSSTLKTKNIFKVFLGMTTRYSDWLATTAQEYSPQLMLASPKEAKRARKLLLSLDLSLLVGEQETQHCYQQKETNQW